MPALAVPTGVAAYLDWATGVTRINRSLAEWSHLREAVAEKRLSPADRGLVEVITHEEAHYYQICTTGYLYRFAMRLWAEIRKCVRIPEDPGGKLEILRPPHSVETLASLMADFDREGPDGVSVRVLAETHAYLVQKRVHYPTLLPPTYAQVLDSVPSPEYRLAYDLAAEKLGWGAFTTVALLISLALCTTDPPSSYGALLEACSRGRLIWTGPQDSLVFRELLVNAVDRSQFIGTAVEAAADEETLHPFFGDTVEKIEMVGRREDLPVLELLALPYGYIQRFESLIGRPRLFNPSLEGTLPLQLPTEFFLELVRQHSQRRAVEFSVMMLAYSAASNEILHAVALPPK